MAFTSSSVDPKNNYELFEQMGDATIGKFIVWDAYEKFPQFRGNPDSIEIVARMKIVIGSKNYLHRVAEDLDMWSFVSASENVRQLSRKDLLEDVFEALIGVIEFVVKDYTDESKSYPGLAYQLVYELLSKLFEPYTLQIDYNVLVDSKNRLQGVFDEHKTRIGSKPIYTTNIQDNKMHLTKVFCALNDSTRKLIGHGLAYRKKDSEKTAAEEGILTLKTMGFVKTVPAIYKSLR
jgi:dsRNA-specific ribonuclease